MILFKNLAMSVLFRTKCVRIRRAVLLDNLTLSRSHEFKNFNIYRGKSAYGRAATRGFCTQSSKISERSMEDLLADEEVYGEFDEGQPTPEVFEEISAGDPDVLKKLKILEFEVAVLREEERRVPDKLSKTEWKELLYTESPTKRKKLLAFFRLNELKRLSSLQKSEGKRRLWQKTKEDLGFHYYGLSGHTMFMRIYEKDINRLLTNRIWNSKLDILLDCSYQEYMSLLNLKACAKQIFYTFSEARLHRYPCQVKLCNFNKDDALGKILPNYICGVYDNFYADIHSDSYLDLYPKEKLVYLSPHAPAPLVKFNHDDVYIIGAYVDKGTGAKASLAKAKQHHLRMARFPIDEYLLWKKGTKSLPLNVVLSILLDMAFYEDWNKAFNSIPSRCLTEN